MSKFFTMLTQIGEAKFANATALGSTVKLEKLAIGDGGGTLPTPHQTQTALVNEVRRDMLNAIKVDEENASWIICEQVIPENVGGWTIREVGLYDADGDLVAVGNFPETYKPVLQEGSGRTQTIQVVLQVSSSSSVELKIDPSIVLASRDYVDKKVTEHEEKPDPHSQYATDNALSQAIQELKSEQLRGQVGLIGAFHNPNAIAGWVDLKGGELSRTTDMLLWDYAQASGLVVSQATKDAAPMDYAMYFGEGDGSTTFTLPNHHLGHFVRGNPSGVNHGETQNDAIRNISGVVDKISENFDSYGTVSGCFEKKQGFPTGLTPRNPDVSNTGGLSFNAALVVPTADENRPYTANLSIKIHRGWM